MLSLLYLKRSCSSAKLIFSSFFTLLEIHAYFCRIVVLSLFSYIALPNSNHVQHLSDKVTQICSPWDTGFAAGPGEVAGGGGLVRLSGNDLKLLS